jgi:elongation factor Ts
MLEQGKPENIIDKIVAGKIDKYYSEICLLEQKYVKDPDLTVEDYLKSVIGKLGENMMVKRFVRFEIGS